MTKMKDNIKRNILSLHYNKHLEYKVTSIIVAFTYSLTIAIAWITQQLRLQSYSQMSVIAILSIVVLTPSVYFFINSGKHLNKILFCMKETGS